MMAAEKLAFQDQLKKLSSDTANMRWAIRELMSQVDDCSVMVHNGQLKYEELSTRYVALEQDRSRPLISFGKGGVTAWGMGLSFLGGMLLAISLTR